MARTRDAVTETERLAAGETGVAEARMAVARSASCDARMTNPADFSTPNPGGSGPLSYVCDRNHRNVLAEESAAKMTDSI
jgi:hypothetical protein